MRVIVVFVQSRNEFLLAVIIRFEVNCYVFVVNLDLFIRQVACFHGLIDFVSLTKITIICFVTSLQLYEKSTWLGLEKLIAKLCGFYLIKLCFLDLTMLAYCHVKLMFVKWFIDGE
jgi:hypothetical protein